MFLVEYFDKEESSTGSLIVGLSNNVHKINGLHQENLNMLNSCLNILNVVLSRNKQNKSVISLF